MTKICDGISVGVYIWSEDHSAMLLIERATNPPGIACVAGHGDLDDEHATLEDVARDEVREEIGLEVTSLTPLAGGGYYPGLCRRPGSRGHTWHRFTATVTGTPVISPREVRNVRWWNLPEIQTLANRTADYAIGRVSTAAFITSPGLEPAWCWHMAMDGHIQMSPNALQRIEALATTPPSHH